MGGQRRNREHFRKRKIAGRGRKVNSTDNPPKPASPRSRRRHDRDLLEELDGIDFS